MLRNERGYGIVNLLVTLAVVVALSYFMLKQMSSNRHETQEIQKIEAHGAVLPNGQAVTGEKAATDAVQAELQKAAALQAQKVDCTENEGTPCHVPAQQ